MKPQPLPLDDNTPRRRWPIAVGLIAAVATVALGYWVTKRMISDSRRDALALERNALAMGQSAPGSGKALAEAKLGDVRLRVVGASVKRVELKNILKGDAVTLSPSEVLEVRIEAINNSETKKIDYHSVSVLFPDEAFVTDEFNNKYNLVNFGTLYDVIADSAFLDGAIYPGKALRDAYAFERPVPKAKTLTMKLSGKTAGEKGGEFTVTFPAP